MNVGVIGVGVQGERHARVYSDMKRVDGVYIFDTSSSRALDVSRKHDIVVSRNIDNLMSDVDAISICTPTSTHAKLVETAISIGMPFIVEKPFAEDFEDARKLIELKDGACKYLTCGVGHIERFNPIVGEIAGLMHSPKYVEIKRHNPSSARLLGQTNVVDDLMIHDIDVLFNVFFKDVPYTIHAVGTPNMCSVLFRFVIDNEIIPVYISASRMSAKKTRTIYIENDQWTIDGNYIQQEVYVHRTPKKYEILENKTYQQENVVDKVELGKIEPLRVELETFIDCVLTGSEFPVTLEEATENVEVCGVIKKLIGV
jgi:predicted dehydrogenase